MERIKKVAVATGFGILFSALVLGGLGSVPAKAAEKQLLVGSVHSMSGTASRWGIICTRGTQGAVDTYNEKGGLKIGEDIYKVKLINYDSGGTPEGAVTAAHRLIFGDGVKYIIGINMRRCSTALQPVAEKEKVVAVGAYLLQSKDMAPPNYYSFSIWPDQGDIYVAWFSWLRKTHPTIKTLAILNKDDDYGRGAVQSMKKVLENYPDYKIVYEQYYPVETVDFYPYLAKIKMVDPSYIDIGCVETRASGLIVKQAYQLGLNKIIFNSCASYGEDLVKIAGAEACSNVLFSSAPIAGTPGATPRMENLNKLSLVKYNEPFDPLTAGWYDAAYATLTAIEKAQNLDTTKVVQVMGADNFRWDSIFGTAKFKGKKLIGQNRSISYAYCIYGIEKGKTVLKATVPPEAD